MDSEQLDCGIILHELSNIGMAIQAGAQLLQSAVPHSPRALEAAGTLQHGTLRLKETLSALRTICAPSGPSAESGRGGLPVAACSMLGFVRDFARDPIFWQEKGKSIQVTGDSDEAELFDPDLVRMVLRNFLANALNHSAAGARIVVRVKHSRRETRILVANPGARMPDDVRAGLFQPGHRGTGAGHGAGLGLHIARRCARALHGTIRYRSMATQTVFCLILPIRRPPAGGGAKRGPLTVEVGPARVVRPMAIKSPPLCQLNLPFGS